MCGDPSETPRRKAPCASRSSLRGSSAPSASNVGLSTFRVALAARTPVLSSKFLARSHWRTSRQCHTTCQSRNDEAPVFHRSLVFGRTVAEAAKAFGQQRDTPKLLASSATRNLSCDSLLGLDMQNGYPDLTQLYRWPFTRTDNPNTVIEPTTRCNLSCPGCYRVSRLAHGKNRDMTLQEMKQYVDDVVRLRNTSCLSFLGGEPLLHEQLNDAIAYAKQHLNVGIYTNGLLLDEQRLREFRELGVSYILIHVDKHQGRGDTEEEINQIRTQFCEMFRKVGGIQLGFSFQLMEKDVPDLPTMVSCFTENSDVVRIVGLSLCTDAPPDGAVSSVEPIGAGIARREAETAMCKAVEEAFGLQWYAYLGTKCNDRLPGKMTALCTYHKGKLLGSIDSDVVRQKTRWAFQKYGKYPYIEKIPLDFSLSDLKHLFLNRSVRGIYRNLFSRFGLKIDWQLVTVSFSPLLTEEKLNVCESCIDAVLHKGNFTPMCTLESVIEAEAAATN